MRRLSPMRADVLRASTRSDGQRLRRFEFPTGVIRERPQKVVSVQTKPDRYAACRTRCVCGRARTPTEDCSAAAARRSAATTTGADRLLGQRALALGRRDLRLGSGPLGRTASEPRAGSCALVAGGRRVGVSSRWLAAHRCTAAGFGRRRLASTAATARGGRATAAGAVVLVGRGSLALGTRRARVGARPLGELASRLSLGVGALGRHRPELAAGTGAVAGKLRVHLPRIDTDFTDF